MRLGFGGVLLLSAVSLTPRQTAEIRRVEDRLLSPCCYTQPVSEHMSDVAVQMRADITTMVASGQDEEQIVRHYKAEYGERILVVPDGRIGTTLFRGPEILCLLALIPTLFMIRKFLCSARAAAAVSDISPEHYALLRNEIESATADMDDLTGNQRI
ncbi:MAG TPA: cytochrome c-type biogenesis protein CcmH [Verrucomicrobiae bacterium]|nr:cytochrome c-type biogenesis protein CcmH [Verrucomicrobiae bacterium]